MQISVCMIVKNEINNLKELLPQIKEFADEIIIVDTGSNDGTVEYLNDIDFINLFKIKWEKDFSKARNFSISKATKDFILWLDADDRILDTVFFNNLKNTLKSDTIYFFKILNSSDNTFFYQIRLFPNNKEIKFEGKIHEQVVFNRKNLKIEYIDLPVIIHMGYENRELLIKKHRRNIELIENINEKSFYDLLQLAESYKITGNFNKAYEILVQLLEDSEIKRKNIEIFCFIHFEIYRLMKILNLENPEKYLFKIKNYAKNFPLILYYVAREFYLKGDFHKAEEYFENFLKFHKNFKYLNPVPEKIENSALYFLAKTKININKKDDAKGIIKRLLEIDPENKSYQSLKRLL